MSSVVKQSNRPKSLQNVPSHAGRRIGFKSYKDELNELVFNYIKTHEVTRSTPSTLYAVMEHAYPSLLVDVGGHHITRGRFGYHFRDLLNMSKIANGVAEANPSIEVEDARANTNSCECAKVGAVLSAGVWALVENGDIQTLRALEELMHPGACRTGRA